MDLGSGIRDPRSGKNLFRITDPEHCLEQICGLSCFVSDNVPVANCLLNWSSVLCWSSDEKRSLLAEFALPVRIVFMLLGCYYSMKLVASKMCCISGSFGLDLQRGFSHSDRGLPSCCVAQHGSFCEKLFPRRQLYSWARRGHIEMSYIWADQKRARK
jgi:hypothetical protein